MAKTCNEECHNSSVVVITTILSIHIFEYVHIFTKYLKLSALNVFVFSHETAIAQIKENIDQLCIIFLFPFNNIVSLVQENSIPLAQSHLFSVNTLLVTTNSTVVYYLQ